MTFRILEYPESGLIFAFFVIFKLRIPDTGYSSIQYPVSAGLKTSLTIFFTSTDVARRYPPLLLSAPPAPAPLQHFVRDARASRRFSSGSSTFPG